MKINFELFMKNNIFKIATLLTAGFFAVSCVHDPVDDIASIGKKAPTVYWENVSAEVSAGDSVSFQLQYYGMDGKSIREMQVWHDLSQQTIYSATCPLVTSFTYKVSSDTTILAREFLVVKNYEQNQAYWDPARKAYYFEWKFPTSYTLATTSWTNIEVFDQEKFDAYFPAGFAEEFRDSIYSKAQVADLKKILTVTNPRFEEDQFMTFVDSTYNDNSGRYDHFIKDQYIPLVKAKFYEIPTDSFFYDSSTSTFKLEYEQIYWLGARAKAVDTDGVVGVAELKSIKLR